MQEYISIRGGRSHNLKNIDTDIPSRKLTVITGVSGSGKSTLAFDTIYAEGQRRYVESLSSYARQFLGRMDKPEADSIDGLSPAIAIDQKGINSNPRSTVATTTEIYDCLRLLYSRIGTPYCPKCGKKITSMTAAQAASLISQAFPAGTKYMLMAPAARNRKGECSAIIQEIFSKGYSRIMADGKIYTSDDEIKLEKNRKHSIYIVIDRLISDGLCSERLLSSCETAFREGQGLLTAHSDGREITCSEKLSCPDCGISLNSSEPSFFSFNSPSGACPECFGIGFISEPDEELIIPDDSISLQDGAIVPWGSLKEGCSSGKGQYFWARFKTLAKKAGIRIDIPFRDLDRSTKHYLLYGNGGNTIYTEDPESFEGCVTHIKRRHDETESGLVRDFAEQFMTTCPCHACKGKRLRPEALSVKINGLSIADLCEKTSEECMEFLKKAQFREKEKIIAEPILKEIYARLEFFKKVGLEYLTLNRTSSTLSGGESQRIRLATQIGSGLTGVLYVLDEPSIGLHQKDNEKLISAMKSLRDLGNTVIAVEHDEDTMRAADWIIDIGPGAGNGGGRIIGSGTAEDLEKIPESITGQYLSGRKKIPVPDKRRKLSEKRIKIIKASENNLKNIDVEIPLGGLICVSGVSGSGKSTLVNDILYKAAARKLNRSSEKPGKHESIEGLENIDKIVIIDQSPIGRTPRSNPLTYTGAFTQIREIFSSTKISRMRGYNSGRFSFNMKGGRCEACQGDGIIKIEMHFLPDVYVKCDECDGKRYDKSTLEAKFKDKSISDILEMTIDEAFSFFEEFPGLKRKLGCLKEVGLGYMRTGQSSTTLSGGEAQRVKLASELSKKATGRTLYILDEPTTGLHFDDIAKLLSILDRISDSGNTALIIEHNMDVLKCADWIIDLGPEGGRGGGEVIACGTPEDIAANPKSITGRYLKKYLSK